MPVHGSGQIQFAGARGNDTLHVVHTTPHVPAGPDADPDTANDSDSDDDNEGIDVDIPDDQDTQGQLGPAEKNNKSLALEIANHEKNMDSDGGEDNGVDKGGNDIQGGYTRIQSG